MNGGSTTRGLGGLGLFGVYGFRIFGFAFSGLGLSAAAATITAAGYCCSTLQCWYCDYKCISVKGLGFRIKDLGL